MNVVKIVVNFMFVLVIEMFGEVFVLFGVYGVVMCDFFDVIISSVFLGFVYEGYGVMIVEWCYEFVCFKVCFGLKDVWFVLEVGDVMLVLLLVVSVVCDSLFDVFVYGGGD